MISIHYYCNLFLIPDYNTIIKKREIVPTDAKLNSKIFDNYFIMIIPNHDYLYNFNQNFNWLKNAA